MIPQTITSYLDRVGASYRTREHSTTYRARELADALHVTDHRVAKTVMVEVDGRPWLVVLPADERVDLDELALALDADSARLLDEAEFAMHFPECALGAAPPFGSLYGLPVAAEKSLTDEGTIVFNAGSHEDAIEMSFSDFTALERPWIASFGVDDS